VRDPNFRSKAARVMDLYARTFDGVPLSEDKYVISADEKASIQSRCRCHPTLAPGQARAMRVNHEYDRGGALAYLAAYDVHRAKVFGQPRPARLCRAGRVRSWAHGRRAQALAVGVLWP
jgi:hypothetical protein